MFLAIGRKGVMLSMGLVILSALLWFSYIRGESQKPTGGGPPVGFYIPQFGHGVPPGTNLLFSTEVNVINLEESRSQYRIRTYDANGAPLAMLREEDAGGSVSAVDELSGEFAGRGTVRLNSFANPGQLAVGWAILTTDDAVGVEVVFNIFDAASGELLTATNVRVGLLFREATFLAFDQLRQGPGEGRNLLGAQRRVRSGVALLNPLGNVSPAQVDLSVFDSNGEGLAETSITLDLGERTSMFVDELVDVTDFEGSVRLRSFNPQNPEEEVLISVLPLRQEGLVLTTQLVFPPVVLPEPAGTGPLNRFFWISQYGHGVPPGTNLLFTTEVYAVNLDSEASEYRIEAYDGEGNQLRAIRGTAGGAVTRLDGQIPFGGTARINSQSDPGQLALGWALITTNDFVAVEVVFNIFDATTGELLTSTNVAVPPIITAVGFFAFDQFREGIQELSPLGARRRVRSGVALMNPLEIEGVTDGTRAAIDLFALNTSGVIVGETTVILDPGQRTSMFIDELIDGLSDFEGTIELRSRDPLQIEGGTPIGVLPLRQEGLILTTQNLFPPRVLRER